MQQKLEAHEETALEMQETYASLQQEVEVKTKKLKKVRYFEIRHKFDIQYNISMLTLIKE